MDTFKLKYELAQLCGFRSFQKWSLLYRASSDGFDASNFHAKCDNISKTFILIKAVNSNILGGYTEAKWDRSCKKKTDANAYIFSLVNEWQRPVKLNIAEGNEENAIFCHPKYMPVFGSGRTFGDTDFYIKYDSANSPIVIFNFGKNYGLDESNESTKSGRLLGYLIVEEIEVFHLK